MTNHDLTDEQDLIRSVESGEWTQAVDESARIEKARDYAAATLRKDKRMNIRISERDLRNLKVRALEEGVPYQTLVSMVLHKYLTGALVESERSR